jgi:flagellar FliL protein
MAEKKPEAAPEGEAPKKKGKLILFIIIGVVVLALIGGGAAFFLMKKKPVEGEEGDEEATAKVEKAKKKDKKKDPHAAPAFYKFDKPFTVKLVAEGGEAYLQVDVQLKLLSATLTDELKSYDPEIKHKVTLLLLGKKSTDLNTAQGVQRLSNEIRDTINHIIEPPSPKAKKAADHAEPEEEAGPDEPVQAVLFTTFIVQ